jgi:4-amino-4-deoxy-L-arabinose transferase-like glycosyltransferase
MAEQRDQPTRVPSPNRQAPKRSHSLSDSPVIFVLALGVVLRLVVFLHMGYLNNDNHLEVIEYVAERWLPARADQFNQAHHPPLYYYLAAFLLDLGSVPAVHALSLTLSIATLLLIARLLGRLAWMDEKVLPWCLALAAFQPQFIMFSLFISNDTLAIFLGVLIFYQCLRVQIAPSFYNCLLLGIWLGLGLLTKAVFLVFVLPLILFLWLTGLQRKLTYPQLGGRIAGFLLIGAVIGCYKFVENYFLFGNPIISNLDLQSWTRDQQPTWVGLRSLLDFNVLKLMETPVISVSTVHSYPLLIYGSFWYSFIPESTFVSNLTPPLNRLGSLIYLLALCPTLLMLVGASRTGMAILRLSSAKPMPGVYVLDRLIYEGTLLLIFLFNLLLVLAVGWRHDVWSVFQGRLLFPSYFALLLAFSSGLEWVKSSRLLKNATRSLMIALITLFVAYLIVDVWLAIHYPVNPLRTSHWPWPYGIDMKAP